MKYEFFFLMRRYFKLNKKKEILQCFFLRSRLNKIFFLKLLEKYIQFFNFSIYYCQNIAKRIKQIPIIYYFRKEVQFLSSARYYIIFQIRIFLFLQKATKQHILIK